MRWWGILCVMLCCAGTGLLAADRLRREVSALDTLCAWVQSMTAHIRYERTEIAELLGESELGFAQETARHIAACLPLQESWEAAVRADGMLPAAARECLLHLGKSLGTTDCDGQTAALTLCGKRLESALESARENFRVKGRLYRAMGFLTGAMAAVLLL